MIVIAFLLILLPFAILITLELIMRNKKSREEVKLRSSNIRNNQDSRDVLNLTTNTEFENPKADTMKIAISTNQGFVSTHFGRCPSYTLFEIKDGQISKKEEILNPGHQPGFLPNYLSELGINWVITGGIGSRAQSLFSQKNIDVISGIQGTPDEAIKQFINKELEAGEDLCGNKHWDEVLRSEHCEENAPQPEGDQICITAQGWTLDSEVDPNFGRAPYFLIVNPEMLSIEAVKNPNTEVPQGAGIQSAQLICKKKVGTLLTGQCGPKAQEVLRSSNIKVITGFTGKALDALSEYKNGVEQWPSERKKQN
ncbi:NifB/NifX family molybdenum-iron cluster-binding protein, partial [Acidobacteriota bacterium]